ncbi:MAG: calcium/sodium antiporter [Clostridia bacterium]|nr:calcium/sodium antiporter [Clostridia bacterium]
MAYLLLFLGLYMLIKGAGFFVEGSSGIAKSLRVPPLLIGLTIVAFGTSTPEAAVSITASLEGLSGISLGNVLGSNIFNTAFIIGLTALMYPMKIEQETIRKEIPFTLLASIMLLVVIADKTLQSYGTNLVSRADGFILLLVFSVFIYYLFEMARNNREKTVVIHENSEFIKPLGTNLLFTLGGLAGIILGGNFAVKGSTAVALALGMSEALIGLTIIAIGTSLPELITSITAAIKKETEIAIGNVIGSNIFNILFILGVSSIINPLAVDEKLITDTIILIFYTIILFIFSRTQHTINKFEGTVLFMSYLGYMIFIVLRN